MAVWIALLAVWLQALLPAVHHPSNMAGQTAFGLAHNLCLAPGSLPADPADKGPAHKPLPCPICQTFQILAAGFAPPDRIVLPMPRDAGIATHVAIPAPALAARLQIPTRARGPPFPT